MLLWSFIQIQICNFVDFMQIFGIFSCISSDFSQKNLLNHFELKVALDDFRCEFSAGAHCALNMTYGLCALLSLQLFFSSRLVFIVVIS